MNSSKRLLVVTPTLGISHFLDRTVQSVRSIPLFHIHVLCCPAPRMEELRERYPHCTVVRDAGREGGIYGALNAALTALTDDWHWFTYINDDDELTHEFSLMAFTHFARETPEPVAYGNVGLIDEQNRLLGLITIERKPTWFSSLLKQGISPLMQQGTLFSRETVLRIKGFDTKYRLCADLDFWLRAYIGGSGFRYYNYHIAQFRLRAGQLSGQTALTIQEQDEIVARHLPAVSRLRQRFAKLRYRFWNLPQYLRRIWSRGFVTSYQLLQQTPEAR